MSIVKLKIKMADQPAGIFAGFRRKTALKHNVSCVTCYALAQLKNTP